MILTRTPFRIPIGGGGTDLPAFYKQHGGFLFSACINKYVYVAVNRSMAEKLIRITHSDAEAADSLEEIKHDLAREALKYSGLPVEGLEIVSFADMPPGTGLGSSGSYLVGVLKALSAIKKERLEPQELAEIACRIEIDILKKPVGKQDQYLAAFGGFLAMDIAKNGEVKAERLSFPPELIRELNSKCLMFYTFQKHDTVKILAEQSQKAAVSGGSAEKAMLKIKDIGKQLLVEMKSGKLENFGKFMHEHWLAKKTISSQMSDFKLDEIYETAMRSGAEGGKIMGSGGGGCFLFFVPENQQEFAAHMEKQGLSHIAYNFEAEGAKAIL